MRHFELEGLSKGLETVARCVIANRSTGETGLGPKYFDEFTSEVGQGWIPERLAGLVQQLSSGRFLVERVARDTVDHSAPYSIAFRCVEVASNAERFFVVGPFSNGLSYAPGRSSSEVAKSRDQQVTSQRRSRQKEEGAKQLEPLAALLAERLRRKLHSVADVRREDALAHLNEHHVGIKDVAGACEAAGISLTSLLDRD